MPDQIDYVPAAHQSGGIQTATAEILTVHSMECPPDDGHVTNQVRSLASPAGGTLFAHDYLGPGVLYRVAPLGRVVAHVGGGNMVRGRWTYGLEQAGNADDLRRPDGTVWRKAMTRQEWIDSGIPQRAGHHLASLIADGHGAARWLTAADLAVPGARGITSHNEMRLAFGGTTHTDPGPNYPYDLLMEVVTGSPGPSPAPPTPSPQEDDVNRRFVMQKGHPEVYLASTDGTCHHVADDQHMADITYVVAQDGGHIIEPPKDAPTETVGGVEVWVIEPPVFASLYGTPA